MGGEKAAITTHSYPNRMPSDTVGVQHMAEGHRAGKTRRMENTVSCRSINCGGNLLTRLGPRRVEGQTRAGIVRRRLNELSQWSQPSHGLSTQQDELGLADIANFLPALVAHRSNCGADSRHHLVVRFFGESDSSGRRYAPPKLADAMPTEEVSKSVSSFPLAARGSFRRRSGVARPLHVPMRPTNLSRRFPA